LYYPYLAMTRAEKRGHNQKGHHASMVAFVNL